MKKILLCSSIIAFSLFVSCEKEEAKPSSLAIDLQNGYWEVDFGVSINVMKFEVNTATSYWIEGTPSCITESNSQGYTLDGNILILPTAENPLIIDIQGDIFTILDEVDQFQVEFNRKTTLDYTDC